MMLLLLRLTLAPLLILAGSLAQRRWGQAIGGRLIGLPLTSLPLLFLLSISDGSGFASSAARASLSGGVAQSAWCVAYVFAARRLRPLTAAALATGAFAVFAFALDLFPLPILAAALISSGSIVAALVYWPTPDDEVIRPLSSRSDVPVRMGVAAAFTLLLTESASSLGARPAGLVGALPLITIVLAVGTHHRDGAAAVNRFLHGVMAGSFSVVAALAVVAVLLPHDGLAETFLTAVAASVLAQFLPTERPRALNRLHPTGRSTLRPS